ncbi:MULTISPECIES: hypothetical protein [unclassified Pseudomonas]|uniref:hypothetical protein n=1 Tax=unclassified Pseudomonas TaxID=196821 RepID=UPI00244916AF|nr:MULTISPECIES: hypothetical protein [unclassified Pseudomonas]MDH0302609.1 hypothetical protein [Pseudomonas sp. GD04091]MDH1983672.1 hypothetical protein [Pseudomonas sp. GD03689]
MNALERPLTSPRTDAWAANAAHSTVHYHLQTEAEPDSLCRVLNLFALQFLTPHSVQVNQHDDLLDVTIGVGGLSWHRAEVIAQKLRNLVCVTDVSLDNRPHLAEVSTC